MKKEVTLDEMKDLAKEWVSSLSPKEDKATIIGLQGNLGAGKTTFTQFVAQELGIEEEINSPTFVIQKRYTLNKADDKGFENLIHIDAYRLEEARELEVLDWEDLSNNPKNLILIEWPEQVGDLLKDFPVIKFKFIDDTKREVEFY